MSSIYRKELRSYFTNMHGYIFGAFLLLICGIFFYVTNLVGGSAYFEYALQTTSFIFLLIVPIVTMKCIAEEKHQRTDQLLYSLPLSTTEIVLGKFFALYTVFLIPLSIMGIYPLILTLFGTVNLAGTYSCILGFFLLGGALLSIGLFISSLTESQVIAAVISFGVVLLMYLMTSLATLVPTTEIASVVAFSVVCIIFGLCVYAFSKDWWISGSFAIAAEIVLIIFYMSNKAAFAGLFQRVLTALSIYDVYYQLSVGIFDLTAVVYFLSVMAVCLFLTVQSLDRKRYN